LCPKRAAAFCGGELHLKWPFLENALPWVTPGEVWGSQTQQNLVPGFSFTSLPQRPGSRSQALQTALHGLQELIQFLLNWYHVISMADS